MRAVKEIDAVYVAQIIGGVDDIVCPGRGCGVVVIDPHPQVGAACFIPANAHPVAVAGVVFANAFLGHLPGMEYLRAGVDPGVVLQQDIAGRIDALDLKILLQPDIFAEGNHRREILRRRPGRSYPAYPLDLNLCPALCEAGHQAVIDAALQPAVMAPQAIRIQTDIVDPCIPMDLQVLAVGVGEVLGIGVCRGPVVCAAGRVRCAVQIPCIHIDGQVVVGIGAQDAGGDAVERRFLVAAPIPAIEGAIDEHGEAAPDADLVLGVQPYLQVKPLAGRDGAVDVEY